jgi:hypothetical protein
MEAGKNSVIYKGLISGPNKADDTCGQTTVTGTMDRGFTVLHNSQLYSLQPEWLKVKIKLSLCLIQHTP